MAALSALQIEALFVRHEAAIRLRKKREIDAWEALRIVVIPSEESLAASLAVAQEKGVSTVARELAQGSYGRQREQQPALV